MKAFILSIAASLALCVSGAQACNPAIGSFQFGALGCPSVAQFQTAYVQPALVQQTFFQPALFQQSFVSAPFVAAPSLTVINQRSGLFGLRNNTQIIQTGGGFGGAAFIGNGGFISGGGFGGGAFIGGRGAFINRGGFRGGLNINRGFRTSIIR